MLHKKIISRNMNSERLTDLIELLDIAQQECNALQSAGVEKNCIEPYLVDDVSVDVYNGDITIYYHNND